MVDGDSIDMGKVHTMHILKNLKNFKRFCVHIGIRINVCCYYLCTHRHKDYCMLLLFVYT